jgi:hypothetical protein
LKYCAKVGKKGTKLLRLRAAMFKSFIWELIPAIIPIFFVVDSSALNGRDFFCNKKGFSLLSGLGQLIKTESDYYSEMREGLLHFTLCFL